MHFINQLFAKKDINRRAFRGSKGPLTYVDTRDRPKRYATDLHTAQATVTKLSEKLQLFMKRSEKCAEWVNRAEDDMRSGIHHPRWAGFIELEETMA